MNMRSFVLCFFICRVICEDVKSPVVKQGTVCLDCQKAPTVNLACGLKEIIAFNGIYYGAKKDESCKTGTKFDCETTIPTCCIPSKINGDDCSSIVDRDAYYAKCIGHQSCTIEFSDDEMICDKSTTQPNYAGVSYMCIPENKNFVYLEQDSKAKDTIVYLMNTNYPSAVNDYSVITCSVETSCGKMLNINSFDMYFGHKDGSGCAQELSITDLTKTYKKTCFQNNTFRKIRYFVSNKNFLILTFHNKIKSESSYVWLEISDHSQREEVEVICGNVARTRPSSCYDPLPLIDRFKQGIPVAVTTSSIPVNTTEELKTGKSVAVEDDSQVKTITLSLVLIVLLVLGIVFGIYLYKKKKQLKITPDSEEDEVVSAHSDTEPIDSRPPVSTRNEENTQDPSTSTGRSRRRDIIPPLPKYPALLSRHSKILPTLGDVTSVGHLPSVGQLPRDNRKTLPKIRPRIQRRDSSDYEYE